MKKLISLILCAALCLSLAPAAFAATSTAPSYSDPLVNEMVHYEGYKLSDFSSEYRINDNWCAWFISYCANNIGLSGTSELDTSNLFPPFCAALTGHTARAEDYRWAATNQVRFANWMTEYDKAKAYYFNLDCNSIFSIVTNDNWIKSTKASVTPACGDIFIENNYSHIGVVVDYDAASNIVTICDGNSTVNGATDYSGSVVAVRTKNYSTWDINVILKMNRGSIGTAFYPASGVGTVKNSVNILDGYNSGSALAKVSAGTSMTVTELIKSSDGASYYKVTGYDVTGAVVTGYVRADEFEITEFNSAMEFSGVEIPKSIKQGTDFPLDWKVSSKFSPIYSLTGTIYYGKPLIYIKNIGTINNVNAYEWNMRDSFIDKQMKFDELENGTYRFELKAVTPNFKSVDGSIVQEDTEAVVMDFEFEVIDGEPVVYDSPLANEAAKYEGFKLADFPAENRVNDGWSAWFVNFCANNIGLSGTELLDTSRQFPAFSAALNGNTARYDDYRWAVTNQVRLANWMSEYDKATVYYFNLDNSTKYNIVANENWVPVEKGSFVPQSGDLFISNNYKHIGIVADYDAASGKLLVCEGNSTVNGATGYTGTVVAKHNIDYATWNFNAFIRPNSAGIGTEFYPTSAIGTLKENTVVRTSYNSAAAERTTLAAGETVELKGLVKNSAGECFYEIGYDSAATAAYKGYVYAGAVEITELKNSLSYYGAELPICLNEGDSYALDWHISSSDLPIYNLTGKLYSRNPKNDILTKQLYIGMINNINSYNWDMLNCYIDKQMKFDQLTEGAYRFVLTGTAPNFYSENGSDVQEDSTVITVVSFDFGVIGSEHEHVYYTKTTEPTCTEEGLTTELCICGEGTKTPIPALGHDWGEGKIVKPASPDADGEIIYSCSRCDETKTEYYGYVMPGDINNDGKANLKDAVTLLKYISGEEITVAKYVADVNGDGFINIMDAVLLLKYVTGEAVTIS